MLTRDLGGARLGDGLMAVDYTVPAAFCANFFITKDLGRGREGGKELQVNAL